MDRHAVASPRRGETWRTGLRAEPLQPLLHRGLAGLSRRREAQGPAESTRRRQQLPQPPPLHLRQAELLANAARVRAARWRLQGLFDREIFLAQVSRLG